MKKYSSYKSIKPLNTTMNYPCKQAQSPTHSVSYRKLTTLDLMNQRPTQKSEIYPMSAKYSNLTATNAVRKKMFSSKNQQTSMRPLTLTKQNGEQNSSNGGYGNIRTKINDLQSRLNEIKRNYDQSVQNRKYSEKDRSIKVVKECDKSTGKMITSSKNKENEVPRQKKTQSKLLLQRYQANKKLKNGQSVSTVNLHGYPQAQMRPQMDYTKLPLSPKIMNLNTETTMRKTESLSFNNNSNVLQQKQSYNSNNRLQQSKLREETEKKPSIQPMNSPKAQSPSLKEYVTTFTCDNKLPISHSNSQTNLYKQHNKLSRNNNQAKNAYYVSAILNAFQSKNLTSFENLSRNHLTTSLDILSYIKNAKKQPPITYTCKPLPLVKDNKHTIIFDLDETLIHCNENINMEHDVALPIKFPNGSILKAGINIRPFARQCLKQLSRYFELIVFTASHQCYGNVIVDHLDPNKEFISQRYFRDSCFKTQEGFYVKDLRVVDRDLRRVLLIDNAAYSYCFQLQNGVPVIPFYDNKADLELKSLIPYLKGFLGVSDVRVKNENQMKLSQYTKFKDTKSLVSTLYGSAE